MLPSPMNKPKRVLITLDAVGGLWRYSIDLASCLAAEGIECVLVGFGPAPSKAQQRECHDLRNVALTWARQPLDWMVEEEAALDEVGDTLVAIGREWDVDLLHLNLPSQAAMIADGLPVVVTSHSCIATWWQAVRGYALPPTWQWQRTLTKRGLMRAEAVTIPTSSHGDALIESYGPMDKLHVVTNATAMARPPNADEPIVFAAGRWWDEGKNARTLDAAATRSRWPVVMAGAVSGPNGQNVRLQHGRSLGELSASATFGWMSRAGIFASTAIYEPFGLAVLEAAARGAALVLSDIPTFRELWNEAALFVRADDAEGFAAAMNRLADDATLRHRLGELARARAESFAPDRQVDQVRQVYAAALAAHAPAMATAG
jgi:glycosyltransferase involved in cell wall biosynthesis